MDKYLKMTVELSKKGEKPLEPYDYRFFHRLIAHSCLADELYNRFYREPMEAFDDDGDLTSKWKKASKYLIKL